MRYATAALLSIGGVVEGKSATSVNPPVAAASSPLSSPSLISFPGSIK